MILYHYTAPFYVESIFHAGLTKGHLTRSDGNILQPVVWFTTSQSHYGHGLTNGTEMPTDRQMARDEMLTGRRPLIRKTSDKTTVRIKVKIRSSDKNLIKFTDFARKNEKNHDLFSKITGLSCYIDISKISDIELMHEIKNRETQEGTWWLYFDKVKPSMIEKVEFRTGDTYSSYNFEDHGREEFFNQGLVAVSKESLDALGEVIPSTHKFDKPKAFAVCTDAEYQPIIVVRGGGYQAAFSIDDGGLRAGSMDASLLERVRRWILQRHDELNVCYSTARGCYLSFIS